MSNEFLKITKNTLKKWHACVDGYKKFNELLPNGGTLEESIKALDESGHGFGTDKHDDWSFWLFKQSTNDDDYKNQTLSGYRNSGDYNSGYYNSGDYNSGNRNSGDYNSGNRNSGDYNSGNRNSGDYNSGDYNSGYYNSGNRNSGNRNSGDYNSGDYNSGDYNSGDYNSGWFNDDTPTTTRVFGVETDRIAFEEMRKPDFIFNVCIKFWVSENNMTDEDKKNDPKFYARGGQLRTRDYKEAWKLAWDNADKENRELIRTLPNFNAEKFYNITGIDLRQSN
jgi:hypothetical protein